MRNILITEEQFRTLLKEYSIDDQVRFGEPVAVNYPHLKEGACNRD